MTPKERILAALRGQAVDRTPWSPFLAYWWEAQGDEVTHQGQLRYMESLGADPMLRGFGAAWRAEYPGVQIRTEEKSGWRHEIWETPVGNLTMGYRHSGSGNTWFLVEHPIQKIEDFKILNWIYEHAKVFADGEIDKVWRETGERGLILPILGTEYKTCFQSLVEKWVGTQNLVYFLMDEPEAVEDCLEIMRSVSDRTVELSASCAAEGFIFWEDSSTTNVSPAMFDKYTAPEIRTWGETLKRAGKLLVHHACGHLAHLLPLMAKLPIDAIESISPPPTGNIDIGPAFKMVPEHIAFIGGIEPVFFQNCTEDQLKERVLELQSIARGRRYVLANSDSCPPAVSEEKFKIVSRVVRTGC